MVAEPVVPVHGSLVHSASLPPLGAMAGVFTSTMSADAMATQLNSMRDELIARFAANEDEHRQLRAASEVLKKAIEKIEEEISELRTLHTTTQLNLSTTTDQARSILEGLGQRPRREPDGPSGSDDPAQQGPARALRHALGAGAS